MRRWMNYLTSCVTWQASNENHHKYPTSKTSLKYILKKSKKMEKSYVLFTSLIKFMLKFKIHQMELSII